MADKPAPFQLLKTYKGLIHRQPLFVSNNLSVDSYHLSFLDKNGEKLNNDSEVPSFIDQLPNILPAISERQKALLSMPESWREALINSNANNVDLTLDVNGDVEPETNQKLFCFARHAELEQDSANSKTLLIDLNKFNPDVLTEHLPYWRDRHDVLCATNVNNHDDFSFCNQNQLDLLQGQFYTQPAIKTNSKPSPSVQVLMELLVKLQDPNVDADELANTLNLDISLSYKLLRLMNSAFFGLSKEVESVKQAIVLLGHKKIKTWASLLGLSGTDDKPVELRVVAMTRAKMCELLSKYYKGDAETFFAAGLFSSLDALTDKPMPDLLNNLPLSAELNQALLDRTGITGRALSDVLNYENGNWAALQSSALPIEIIARAYLDAINWAKELNSQLKD